MVSISVRELKRQLADNENIQLVDVREPFEHESYNIGGTLIPLGELFEHSNLLRKDIPVVIYCQKGIRSQIAIQRLEEKLNFNNLVNLTGGMDAWKKDSL